MHAGNLVAPVRHMPRAVPGDVRPLRFERRRWEQFAGGEKVADLRKNPRRTHGRAPEHHAAHACIHAPRHVLRARQVAIADDRNPHRPRHLRDHVPVRRAAVTLLLRPSMHGHRGDARVLQNARSHRRVDRRRAPADANLRRDRHRRARPHHGAGDLFQKRAVAQDRGAAVFRDDLVHRAAKVQVNEIRLFPVDDHARRLAEMLRVAAEKLHAQRALRIDKLQVLQRPLIAAKDALRADEFRHHHIRPVLLRELPENGVRHPGHRREVERKFFVEPRKHAPRYHTPPGKSCAGARQFGVADCYLLPVPEPSGGNLFFS